MTDTEYAPSPLAASAPKPLSGRFQTPGDKAISHRVLILAALAVGTSRLKGLLEAEDVAATAAALRQLGVRIETENGTTIVEGLGVRGLLAPEGTLDMGNSGTGARLLMGVLAPYDFASRFTGAPTLTRRPMGPLLDALGAIGTVLEASDNGHLPITLRGPDLALPIRHTMTAPSDQIKSALLLAGLHSPGKTIIVEPVPTRDHTEKLLAGFGAEITTTIDDAVGATITLTGLAELRPQAITVPGDPSTAAYAIVAALTVPGSDVLVENVQINPTRTGLIDTLLEMGGDIQFINQRETGGEIVADLRVRSSRMKGVMVNAAHAAQMLDDIPILAVAAAYAQGDTRIAALAELRDQECDRLAATAAGLMANGVAASVDGDDLAIQGQGTVAGGGMAQSFGDHRIVMSMLVLGLGSTSPASVDDATAVAASFPGFVTALTALGAQFEPVKGQS